MDQKLRIADIVNESVVDGKGIRMTIFTQGCPHRCEGCHNPQTHDFNGGHEITVGEIVDKVVRDPLLDGITLSGGEPFMQPAPLAALCGAVHARGLNVWTYTGFTLEELREKAAADPDTAALLDQTDVLVDGRFELSKRDLQLVFRGSSNQRVIDMNKTRASGTVVLLPL